VVINRSFGDDGSVEALCASEDVPVLIKIPFDRKVAETYAKGGTLLEAMPDLQDGLRDMYLEIRGMRR
jgi:MinD superfamily P-loop ATPase